jgi:hypothetical protein
MNFLRPQSEEKRTVRMPVKWEWGRVFDCEMIVATFPLSEVAALRALTPDAEFQVHVIDDTGGAPLERVWQVQVRNFKKLP